MKTTDIVLMEKWSEDLISVFNSIGICIRPPSLQSVGPTSIAQILRACVGGDIDAQEVMQAGERIWNLQRLYNLREGERRKNSIFPKRFYKDPLPEGPAKGTVVDAEKVERMLNDYYEARGWDRKDGIPTKEKMAELGLEKDISDLDLTE